LVESWPRHADDPAATMYHEWEAGSGPRERFLDRLLHDGWKAGGGTDLWDLEKDGTRLLLATEHGENGEKNTLIRVWGDQALLPPWLMPGAAVLDSAQ
jgi:hypothetical protein